MEGYLYVVDESGAEIPGSRRHLKDCRSIEDIQYIRDALVRAAGEGCLVLDSEVDRPPDA